MAAAALQTEQLHADAKGLDQRDDAAILLSLLNGQRQALASLDTALPEIAKGAGYMAGAIAAGARIHYAAAGSSGLMSLADCAEIPGTFGISPDQLNISMAGGIPAGAEMPGSTEDDAAAGLTAAAGVQPGDAVIAVSASGSTAYPLAFAGRARSIGARVIAVANNADAALFALADAAIHLPTPPEVIAGSTRMGAGTAQKAALNMMSTLMGIRLGHVVDGMMVNVVADNEKLLRRAAGIVSAITGVPADRAAACLEESGGAVKIAVLLAAGAAGKDQAEQILEQENGQLRAAMARL